MGVLLLVIGLGVLGFGLMNHFKGKRILAAPFKKTGELARNPVSEDPKGAMSTEGKVIPPAQALLSPCSKQPCLYYEVKVERIYEKTETTQDGTKTSKGTETLDTVKGGAVFAVDDGTGAIAIDVTKGADFDVMKDGFKKELNGRSWASNIQFGEFSYDVPPISSSDDSWTIGFKATEKYVPVEGNLFVLGKLEGAKIMKPGWRSMMASSKGREGLLGSIQKKKKFSFIGGGVAAVLSVPLMIWGPAGDATGGSHCKSEIAGITSKCDDNVRSRDGNSYTWTVQKAGKYELQVTPPSGKKFPLDAQIVVKDSKGETIVDESGEAAGKAAIAKIDNLEPGTYTVTVRDVGGMEVKGGFDYAMEIRSDAVGAVADKAEGNETGAKIHKLEKLSMSFQLPADAETMDAIDVLDSVTVPCCGGASIQVNPVKADSMFAAKTLADAKKSINDFQKPKLGKAEATADGWRVEFTHESGMGDMHKVLIRRTINGQAYDCEAAGTSQENALVAAKGCETLKSDLAAPAVAPVKNVAAAPAGKKAAPAKAKKK